MSMSICVCITYMYSGALVIYGSYSCGMCARSNMRHFTRFGMEFVFCLRSTCTYDGSYSSAVFMVMKCKCTYMYTYTMSIPT